MLLDATVAWHVSATLSYLCLLSLVQYTGDLGSLAHVTVCAFTHTPSTSSGAWLFPWAG